MNVLSIQEMTGVSGLGIFFVVLSFVLIAEMGDKSQLLVMAFATRYKLKQVIIGVSIAIIGLNMIAVLMGSLLTTIIPMSYIQLLASLLFIIFGVISFKEDKEEESLEKTLKISPTLAVAVSFFIAELGDKTQLATMAFAASYQAPIQVFLAAVLAMMLADLIGLAAGFTINKYVPKKQVSIFSGIIFMGFGFYGLAQLQSEQQLSTLTNVLTLVVGIGALIVMYMMLRKSSKVGTK